MDTYEKKYNEALGRASHIKDNNTVATPQEVAEHIFPELRESEDERIRKELIIHLEQEERSATLEVNKKRWREMISYLEKQKEQNHDGKKWIYEDDYHKDMERSFNDGKDEVLENPEKYGLQKEQKLAEWSEEDEDAIQQAILALEDRYDEHEPNLHFLGYKLPFNKAAERLKSLKPQSKAEWSEEDEKMAIKIDCYLSSAIGVSEDERQSIDNWLKSLRPQPKQEWGEKDNKMREKLINFLGSSHVPLTYEEFSEYRSWLISLRPQPHWKPSEKQMDALETTAHLSNFGCDTSRRNTLLSLCNDLKKL